MRRLELFESHVQDALSLLGEHRNVFFNEDGSEPTGDAWIANGTLPDELVHICVNLGYGRLIEVFSWTDEDVFLHLGFESASQDILECSFINVKPLIQSHYGVLGELNSVWILSSEHPYLEDSDKERMALFRLAMLLLECDLD